jgi:hypothetical protein
MTVASSRRVILRIATYCSLLEAAVSLSWSDIIPPQTTAHFFLGNRAYFSMLRNSVRSLDGINIKTAPMTAAITNSMSI